MTTTNITQDNNLDVIKNDSKTKSIGNYILGKTIGEGTFGKVKLGTHSLTNEKVAIKILEKSRIIDVADVQRVSREIHILKLIRHPSIIQLYEIIQTPKQLFLVMQYVSDGELFDYIVKKKKIKQPEASQFFQQILNGVEYLHKLNIVHRDLKPQNLLIDFNKKIKLVDFGLSNTYKKNQVLKTACGSPCYAAPQMIAGKKYQGMGVDIWSCGVILFAMVCGYLPFQDPNTSALYKKILAGDFIFPKFVSPEAKELIKGILTTDPQKRLSLKEIKSHKWVNQSKPFPSSQGIIVGYHRIPIDINTLNKLKQFNFDIQASKKCLQSNRHNHFTTTYYLLMKKNLRQGVECEADICSEKFLKNLIQPIPKNKEKEKKDDFFCDELDFQMNSNKRKIMSQIGRRSPPSLFVDLKLERSTDKKDNYTIQPDKNLPNVKNKLGKTLNRFHFKVKKNTVDVDLYDFQDFVKAKNISSNTPMAIHTLRDKVEKQKKLQQYNRTNLHFRQRYASISNRYDNSVDSGRKISIQEADGEKTFRITKNTFFKKNINQSIDTKLDRTRNRALLTNIEENQRINLKNTINSINYRRSTKNNNFY